MGQKRACSEIKHRKKSNSNIVMKDRIRQIMEDQHLNQQNFAQLIGKSTATLSSIFNDRTKPSLDIVDAIKKKLPQVNLEWLPYLPCEPQAVSSPDCTGSERNPRD